MSGFTHAVAGAATLGALSTLGDWIWARYLRDGDPVAGVVHGAVVFLVLAAVLAWGVGSRRAALKLFGALPVAGLLLAAAFYPLARVIGYLGAAKVHAERPHVSFLSSLLVELRRRRRADRQSAGRMRRSLTASVSDRVFFAARLTSRPAPARMPLVYLQINIETDARCASARGALSDACKPSFDRRTFRKSGGSSRCVALHLKLSRKRERR